jgi:hypothetical protein
MICNRLERFENAVHRGQDEKESDRSMVDTLPLRELTMFRLARSVAPPFLPRLMDDWLNYEKHC